MIEDLEQEKINQFETQAKEKFNEIFNYQDYFSNLVDFYENKERKTYQQALKEATEYFDGSEIEASTFLKKYALKDKDGKYVESTPEHMHERLARNIAWVDIQRKHKENPKLSKSEIHEYGVKRFDVYFEAFKDFGKIIPQGSPMAGVGNPFQIMSLSNCFVVGNESDSYGGIMDIDQKLAQLMKRRAGVGTDISHLRPSESAVQNAARTSTGAVSFMERFSETTREVAQSGRRGALMLSIDITHPDSITIDTSAWENPEAITIKGNPESGQRDIETDSRFYNPNKLDFASIKLNRDKVTGANVSLRLRDSFLEAVEAGKDFTQQFPVESDNPMMTKDIDAKKAWQKIMHMAWQSAEPGVLFWDTIIKESLPDCYAKYGFKTRSTNPCGEITLCWNDSCRLVALNLFGFIVNAFKENSYFDFKEFEKYVKLGQRIMDNLVDLEILHIQKIIDKIQQDPEPETIKDAELKLWNGILNKALLGRRTGLGITALGDTIAANGLRYGTDEGTDFAEEIMRKIKHFAYEASADLAKERGAFPMWNHNLEKDNAFLNRIKEENPELFQKLKEQGRRHIAILTIAPTGTTSMMAQTSSGIENVYSLVYFRMVKVNPNDEDVRVDFVDQNGDSWTEYPVFHHNFRTYLNVQGLTNEEIDNLTKEEIKEWTKKSPYYKATVEDVDWLKKVEMQGRIQKHIDHSISVTTNLPEEASEELVSNIYLTAWRNGCKGCTIYRDGSRSGVINTSSKKDKGEEKDPMDPDNFTDLDAPKRPEMLPCDVYHFQNRGEKWISFVGILNDRPYEIFTGLESAFKIPASVTNGYIKKVKVDGETRYDFHYRYYNKSTVAKGLSNVFNPEYWNYAKLISSILRHKMPLQYVIKVLDTLKLENESISSWKRGVIRILRKYVQDGAKVETGSGCFCDKDGELVYQDGCVTCKKCGFSGC